MDKHYFNELLNKYLEGQATQEEKQFLISYYNVFELEPDVKALLAEEKKDAIKNEIRNNIWKNIEAREQPGKKRIFFTPFVRVAAAAIFIAVCTTAIFFATRTPDRKESLVSVLNKQKENRLIHLPDGSTVIVSIGATLNYPASFDHLDKREVYLEGEAFFDISHDPSKPFIVHSGSLATTVLGTAFNIKAIPRDSSITVTVTRGKVKISDDHKTLGLITKGQEIVYDKNKGKSVEKTLTTSGNLAWQKQDLFLDDATLEDAAKLLEDRFNVAIHFKDPTLKSNRFTTVFLKDEGIEQVLNSICEFNGARYEFDKQKSTITITKNTSITN